MKRNDVFRLLILVCVMVLPMIALAQGPPDPNDAPIDGGLSLLLAAGVGYGVKKYREGRKVAKEDNVES
jgi:hypothetical protein